MRTLLLAVAAILLVTLLTLWRLTPADREIGEAPPPAYPPSADSIERGRQLVTLGDCRGCHTARGGAPFAGGYAIPTPFGTFVTPNITPDTTGIGSWSATDFWHALHSGYTKNGTLLYPTFPYTNFTKISRRDADAMYDYLRTIPPAAGPKRVQNLAFPYNHRLLLIAWRWLFFRPGVYEPDSTRSADWNRGAYLVQGLGHCSACHEARNALGAVQSKHNPAGGLVLNWYAPALTSPREAGLHEWRVPDILTLLKTGQIASASASAPHATTMGPMGEVVYGSLQYTRDDDLRAMAVYLKSLPDTGPRSGGLFRFTATAATLSSGHEIYDKHCAQCHGDNGEGRSPAAPPLAGNRAVTMSSAVNPVRIVLFGGYAPGTGGNPRPFGMPPYLLALGDEQIAAVLSFVRASWGNDAPRVSGDEVARNRGTPLF
ncbi:MAG: cytochrome c [Gammaproteobacteria bacterium]|jgi:mono/diheme cytochrome c family protein|nr:cytochrome c [Gammaproteobacteria bacterium]